MLQQRQYLSAVALQRQALTFSQTQCSPPQFCTEEERIRENTYLICSSDKSNSFSSSYEIIYMQSIQD